LPRPTLRDATAADYPTFARLFPELESGDSIPTAERFETDVLPRTVLLEVDGEPVAYAFWRDAGAGTAHVGHLVVDPRRRREGHGRTTLAHLADRFRALGFSRWCLNVKAGNAVALALYESCGLRRGHEWSSLSLPWEALVGLEPNDLVVSTPVAERDAAIEAAFALRAGHIATERARPNRIVLEARDGEGSVGFVSFDPTFPGANPFRASTAAAVSALAHAMRPHALPDAAHTLVMTVDAVARDTLLRAGAELRYEGIYMEAALER
jgi:GNAT superfamily N-acetyltransferase